MYVRQLQCGGFLVPGGDSVNVVKEELLGHGGTMLILNLPIRPGASSYEEFCADMLLNEKALAQAIKGLW